MSGEWRLRQFYDAAYFPMAGTIWLLGAAGVLPRVRRSTKNEGHERRYFYGSVWAVCIAQPTLWLLWTVLPRGRAFDLREAARSSSASSPTSATLRAVACCRGRGPIVPGELAVSD